MFCEKKKCLSMHDLTKIHMILILVDGQKSRGQMSLAVKCPAVKCHLWSNVPRSNVTVVKCPAVKCHLRSNVTVVKCHCGQMSRGQMSLAVKCPAVKCPAVKCPVVKCHLRSNVPRSNVTVVKCHKILKWSKVRGQMSRGQMRLWS